MISLLAPIASAQSNYATPYFFTTPAGVAGGSGSADGSGPAARFNTPQGVAVGRLLGHIVVADTNNHTIRLVSPSTDPSLQPTIVTTLAGQAGVPGNATATGTGSNARFNLPRGVAVDYLHNIYVADTSNHVIRKITFQPNPSNPFNPYVGNPTPPVVTTLAGSVAGAVDGAGTIARFFSPNGVAVDYELNVYVADTANNAIRKITPGGVVSTLAGQMGTFGSVDGTGSAARFSSPRGVAVDQSGFVYVADRDNNSIRKISPAGVVTTIAGNLSFNPGSADGTGSAARFNQPYGVTVDSSGNVYVSESGNHLIRKITPAGVVTTLAGQALAVGNTTNVAGNAVRFSLPQGIAVDPLDNLIVADTNNHTVRVSVTPPVFINRLGRNFGPPAPSFEIVGSIFSSTPVSFEWRKDGVALPGGPGRTLRSSTIRYAYIGVVDLPATSVHYLIANLEATDLGDYTVVATNLAGSTTSNIYRLFLDPSTAGRLVNLSILTSIPAAGETFTMGYVVGGAGTSGTKPLVIRAVGPSLIPLGVPGTLNDPKIELFAGAAKTTENDNWGGSAALSAAMSGVGAFAFTGPASLDAAIATSISPGDNSVKVSAAGNGTGTVIAEIYDATPAASFVALTPRLMNVSVLKHLGTGLTVGFVVGGAEAKTVLIRAVGPTLGAAPFGVPGVVADPQLTLFSGQTSIGTNNNWGGTAALTTAFTAVGAFALPAASLDAALLATLQPGNYTVEVKGAGTTTGVALVEIYDVP